ncbi:unnamed protein product [Choristocarpus tenellus]
MYNFVLKLNLATPEGKERFIRRWVAGRQADNKPTTPKDGWNFLKSLGINPVTEKAAPERFSGHTTRDRPLWSRAREGVHRQMQREGAHKEEQEKVQSASDSTDDDGSGHGGGWAAASEIFLWKQALAKGVQCMTPTTADARSTFFETAVRKKNHNRAKSAPLMADIVEQTVGMSRQPMESAVKLVELVEEGEEDCSDEELKGEQSVDIEQMLKKVDVATEGLDMEQSIVPLLESTEARPQASTAAMAPFPTPLQRRSSLSALAEPWHPPEQKDSNAAPHQEQTGATQVSTRASTGSHQSFSGQNYSGIVEGGLAPPSPSTPPSQSSRGAGGVVPDVSNQQKTSVSRIVPRPARKVREGLSIDVDAEVKDEDRPAPPVEWGVEGKSILVESPLSPAMYDLVQEGQEGGHDQHALGYMKEDGSAQTEALVNDVESTTQAECVQDQPSMEVEDTEIVPLEVVPPAFVEEVEVDAGVTEEVIVEAAAPLTIDEGVGVEAEGEISPRVSNLSTHMDTADDAAACEESGGEYQPVIDVDPGVEGEVGDEDKNLPSAKEVVEVLKDLCLPSRDSEPSMHNIDGEESSANTSEVFASVDAIATPEENGSLAGLLTEEPSSDGGAAIVVDEEFEAAPSQQPAGSTTPSAAIGSDGNEAVTDLGCDGEEDEMEKEGAEEVLGDRGVEAEEEEGSGVLGVEDVGSESLGSIPVPAGDNEGEMLCMVSEAESGLDAVKDMDLGVTSADLGTEELGGIDVGDGSTMPIAAIGNDVNEPVTDLGCDGEEDGMEDKIDEGGDEMERVGAEEVLDDREVEEGTGVLDVEDGGSESIESLPVPAVDNEGESGLDAIVEGMDQGVATVDIGTEEMGGIDVDVMTSLSATVHEACDGYAEAVVESAAQASHEIANLLAETDAVGCDDARVVDASEGALGEVLDKADEADEELKGLHNLGSSLIERAKDLVRSDGDLVLMKVGDGAVEGDPLVKQDEVGDKTASEPTAEADEGDLAEASNLLVETDTSVLVGETGDEAFDGKKNISNAADVTPLSSQVTDQEGPVPTDALDGVEIGKPSSLVALEEASIEVASSTLTDASLALSDAVTASSFPPPTVLPPAVRIPPNVDINVAQRSIGSLRTTPETTPERPVASVKKFSAVAVAVDPGVALFQAKEEELGEAKVQVEGQGLLVHGLECVGDEGKEGDEQCNVNLPVLGSEGGKLDSSMESLKKEKLPEAGVDPYLNFDDLHDQQQEGERSTTIQPGAAHPKLFLFQACTGGQQGQLQADGPGGCSIS